MIRAVCSHIYKTLVFAAVPFCFFLFFLGDICEWIYRCYLVLGLSHFIFFKPGIETLDIRANGANGS